MQWPPRRTPLRGAQGHPAQHLADQPHPRLIPATVRGPEDLYRGRRIEVLVNREDAADLAAEALELANSANWTALLRLDLPDAVIELIRQKASLNIQIENLEEQEKLLWELALQTLIGANNEQ